jgi:hypothetical protein
MTTMDKALDEVRRRCLGSLEDVFMQLGTDMCGSKRAFCDKTTLEQLRTAPLGTKLQPTIYVWYDADLQTPFCESYTKFSRTDLLFVKTTWLLSSAWLGQLYSGIVIDHNTRMTEAEWLSVANIKSRVR